MAVRVHSPLLRSYLLLAAVPVSYAAASPPPDATLTCPQEMIDLCGSSFSCTLMQPSTGFIEDLNSALSNYPGGMHDCADGRDGALEALDDMAAYWVSNWGTCNYGGGFHYWAEGGNGPIFVSSGLSWHNTLTRLWHEGWSRWQRCENFDCHDHDVMFPQMDTCYAWLEYTL